MENNAQSDLLSVVIISAIILAAGITLWVFFSGYALMTRLSAQEEVNKELSVLRSAISADYVICPRGEALIRNVGKEPVVIFRVIVYKNGEMTWDSLREYGVRAFAEIDVNEVSIPPIRFPCPPTREDQSEIGDLVTVQIHYIPKSLFDPSSPELIDPTSDVLLFRIATFQVEKILPKSY
ncbi:MAG: hypothetical protein N3F65_05490 [Nitrososphaeria archaeon]|nr:hypothetical protein [Nitrososphaeria archaeon]